MFPLSPEDTTDPVVLPVFDRLKRRWGVVLNIYRILAWSPKLVTAWASFAWAMRFELDASRRMRELLVVRIAQLLGARYEYEHHLHMALDEGVTTDQVAALDDWRNSTLFDAHEQIVLSLADELALQPGASQDTMTALRSTFGERHAVELLVTGSFYCGVARIINSTQLELEAGHEDLRARHEESAGT